MPFVNENHLLSPRSPMGTIARRPAVHKEDGEVAEGGWGRGSGGWEVQRRRMGKCRRAPHEAWIGRIWRIDELGWEPQRIGETESEDEEWGKKADGDIARKKRFVSFFFYVWVPLSSRIRFYTL